MKGSVLLQLNDDDSILMQATVPLDAEHAKLHHYGFDFEDMAAALAKGGEMLALIKERYVEQKPKSNITTL